MVKVKPRSYLYGILFFTFLFFGFVYFFKNKKSDLDFKYLSIGCDVFDVSGKLLFKKNGAGCSFNRDGSVLDVTPELVDHSDRRISGVDVVAHHVIKFSKDQQSILAIEADSVRYGEQQVKSDCFVKRNLEFKVMNRWCLADHLDELKQLGFTFEALKADYPFTQKRIPNLEISHANTLHEIEENALSKDQPMFSKGNFLVNVFGSSGAMLVLDSEMKKILWSKNMNNFFWPNVNLEMRLPTHDSQILADGRILSYATRPEIDGLRYTYIVLWDPFGDLKKFQIIYKSPEGKDADTPIGGQVALLRNGNYFLTETTKEKSLVYVVSPQGKLLWEFPHPSYKTEKMPFFNSSKPMYDEGFLRSRGLAH